MTLRMRDVPAGADPEFLEKGVQVYKGRGFVFLILSHFT